MAILVYGRVTHEFDNQKCLVTLFHCRLQRFSSILEAHAGTCLDVPERKLGSMVIGSMGYVIAYL